jgi:hypothetical protein
MTTTSAPLGRSLPWVCLGVVALTAAIAFAVVRVKAIVALQQRVAETRNHLVVLRAAIAEYRTENHEAPRALTQIVQRICFQGMNCVPEYISARHGLYAESPVLNGLGGWCYQASNSSVRVNVTSEIWQVSAPWARNLALGREVPANW